MSTQTQQYIFATLVVLIQAGALGLTLWRHSLAFLVWLNLVAAIGVLIAVVPNLLNHESFADFFIEFLLLLFITETAALIASVSWLVCHRLGWLVCIAFAANAVISGFVLHFILTFKITRLF